MSARILHPAVQSWTGSGSRPVESLPRVPLEIVPHWKLLRAAIGSPLRRWTIVLFLESGTGRATEDLHLLHHLVPWFSDLPRHGVALAQLRRHGLTMLTTAEEAVARQLFQAIPSRGHERVRARLFNPEGRVAW